MGNHQFSMGGWKEFEIQVAAYFIRKLETQLWFILIGECWELAG